MRHPLCEIVDSFHSGRPLGITSVCSAHPAVIEAALSLAKENGKPVLIEATCNQVNQDGGYTGMTPQDFRLMVDGLAGKAGLAPGQIILGGDHLGPNPWKHLPAQEAMAKAGAMIAEYARAGFTKLHLDTSMGCKDEPAALADAETAKRAAQLAAIAEANRCHELAPVYIIGTEVPVPGGALEELDHIEITSASAAAQTYHVHREAFQERGLSDAFERVIGLVVQPGVEFGHSDIVPFDAAKAKALSASLKAMPGIIFEAHSTDYQSPEALRQLVEHGFGILKVGPWLTFAMRETLYALDNLADILACQPPRGTLMAAMERIMLDDPSHWAKYYNGCKTELWRLRHFSYSDRIRYYWPDKHAMAALDGLRHRLAGQKAAAPLLAQCNIQSRHADMALNMDDVLIAEIQNVLRIYDKAGASPSGPRRNC